ncbi:hydrogenase nickel incorporation protein HypB [candidate division TA06 bacterium DG_26]|uniref:Hydrogenase nickel incorporation protein HypB n=1 Tax=candidate division TA06 bacterium DG_26 TaxID=1703771 RepID=A0A0S7WJE5_UNCT6|nr:MAG: hydrogenase nickel incorporation protein HypB [candidate division TA06 bacterium DG_26]
MEVVRPAEGEIFDIELDEDFLRRNRELSEKNRQILDSNDCTAIDVLGSVGAGKTSLIKLLVRKLKSKHRIAVVAGDLTTELDAARIVEEGVEVIQINTGKECHLDANLLKKAMEKLDLQKVDVLFIENVGNLICPTDFPLGSHHRIVVVSVTEGPHTVVKHPFIFEDASILVISKVDLCQAMGFGPQTLREDALRINPKLRVVETNCVTGEGVDQVVALLQL